MDIEGYICSETNWIKFFMVTSTLWFLLSSKKYGFKCYWFKNITRKWDEEADQLLKSDKIEKQYDLNSLHTLCISKLQKTGRKLSLQFYHVLLQSDAQVAKRVIET